MSHLSVQTKRETVSSNLHYYVQKSVQLLSLLSMNKCYFLFKVFKQRFYSDISLYIFISTTYIVKFYTHYSQINKLNNLLLNMVHLRQVLLCGIPFKLSKR